MPIITTLTSGGAFARRGGGKAGLYDFATATFTPGGKTGRSGPSLAQARSGISGNDDWKNNTSFLNTSSGIILWTVPLDGIYRFDVAGGKGGNSGSGGGVGGQGGRLRVDVELTQGLQLNLVVGQRAGRGPAGRGGGGGGGSFVYSGSIGGSGLIIAAGGGGGSDDGGTGGRSCRSDFRPEASGGTVENNTGQGGTTGQGSGAGWLSNGTGTNYPGTRWTGADGINFANDTNPEAANGGWGGWGGGGGDGDDGGAGAGFTGGNGTGGAGAGGSYYAGLTANGANAYTSIYASVASNPAWVSNNNGDGFIVVTLL